MEPYSIGVQNRYKRCLGTGETKKPPNGGWNSHIRGVGQNPPTTKIRAILRSVLRTPCIVDYACGRKPMHVAGCPARQGWAALYTQQRIYIHITSKIVTLLQEYSNVNIYIYVTFNDINYQRRVLYHRDIPMSKLL